MPEDELLQKFREFYNKLPESERSTPLITAPDECGGGFMSPREILQHLEANDECGQKLRQMQDRILSR